MKDLKKKIRVAFRAAVFKRDKNRCIICGAVNALDAHHITDRKDMPNGGYVKENGITLCPQHHEMAEEWHRNEGIGGPEGFDSTSLYKKIYSSYETALAASERLSV